MFFSTNSSSTTKNVHDPFCNLPHDDLDHSFHLPISFFPFPSPFEVDDYNNSSSSSSQNNNNNNHNHNNPHSIDNMSMKMKIKIPPRKRLSKKDRHSKITTAKGVRDRRMRLSLPVAQQFFGLQDMLGVDKGSKTVEWLLIQAKPQILKLATQKNLHNFIINSSSSSSSSSNKNNCSNSEIGVIINGDAQNLNNSKEDINIKTKKKKKKKKKNMRGKKVAPIRKAMAKELREKARERARARTLEKKNHIFIRDSSSSLDHHHHQPNFTQIISSSTGGEESAATQSYNNNNYYYYYNPIITSQFDDDHDQFHPNFSSFDVIFPKWSPFDDSTFNFLHQQHDFEDSDIFG